MSGGNKPNGALQPNPGAVCSQYCVPVNWLIQLVMLLPVSNFTGETVVIVRYMEQIR